MFYYFKKLPKNKLLFYLFLALSIIPLFFFKYYVSLDGPQHLYNANVLTEIIKGNKNINDFFKINPVIVGYWSGHFFLAFFKLFFISWLAEKLFIISYIISMAFSFRYLIRSINKENDLMAVLIFPFAYSMYFMMGYYSFSIAFIPLFLLFGFLIRHPELNLKNLLILCLLFLVLFLSHAFVFGLTGIALIVYLITEFIFTKIRKEKVDFISFLKKSLLILLSAIPALILWVIYLKYVMQINDTVIPVTYSATELTGFILRVRQLVAFHHEKEAVGLIPVFNVLVLLFTGYLITVSKINKKLRVKELFSEKNVMFAVAFVFLFLYYIMPDRISAGSLVNRIALMFFYFIIIALAVQKVPKVITIFSVVILFFSFLYLQIYRTKEHINFNKVITDIHSTEKYIKKNSVLYTIRESDIWFDLHYGCYAGVDKPIVNLKSPQNRGQFPIIWNYKNLPVFEVGDKIIFGKNPPYMPASTNKKIKKADYILVYHKHKDYELGKKNTEIINNFYKLIYKSSGGYADLYILK